MRFADRAHAGRVLGQAVAGHGPIDPVVYALPRGGVPVGSEVAMALRCPLDILVVRKIGVPHQPELAMGALAEGGRVVRDDRLIDLARVTEEEFSAVVRSESKELQRRVALYRGDIEPISPQGRTAIVVDDGLATGASARAAVSVLSESGSQAIWLAVPVAPRGSLGGLEKAVDELIVATRPYGFGAVGAWYRDFRQTTDDEVKELLARSRLA